MFPLPNNDRKGKIDEESNNFFHYPQVCAIFTQTSQIKIYSSMYDSRHRLSAELHMHTSVIPLEKSLVGQTRYNHFQMKQGL